MGSTDTELARENAELRHRLQGAAREAAYYKKIARETGRRRLRDLDQLGEYIANLRAAQESLRESQDRYRNLVELCPLPIFVHQNGVLRYLNPATLKMIEAADAEQATGRHMIDFIHPDDRQRMLRLLEKTHRNPEYQLNTGFRILLQSGKVLEIEVISTPTTYEGQTARLVFCIDRTARRRAEREKAELQAKLNRSRKMEALGLLAGGVAHDLNNILSGILTYQEFILMDLRTDHRLRKPLETILESGRRAAAVVQDLLTISRGVAGNREVSNFNDIVAEYLRSPEYEMLAARYPGVIFCTDLAEDLLNVHCSAIHIKKSLMNLVINAAEAIEDDGQVVISTRNRYVGRPMKGYDRIERGEYAVLSVADSGPGISPDDVDRIFEPFYTRKVMGRSGTGLGLTVVWNTVQDHHGYIHVNSAAGGTVFDLYFPVTRSPKRADADCTPMEAYMGSGQRILVVDDEESQRVIAAAILKRLGYAAVSAAGGREALQIIEQENIDAVLLDMVMPDMDGLDTYRRMIAVRPGLPCVIASGFSETEEVRKVQQLGAGPYLKKPYTIERLGVAIKTELSTTGRGLYRCGR